MTSLDINVIASSSLLCCAGEGLCGSNCPKSSQQAMQMLPYHALDKGLGGSYQVHQVSHSPRFVTNIPPDIKVNQGICMTLVHGAAALSSVALLQMWERALLHAQVHEG